MRSKGKRAYQQNEREKIRGAVEMLCYTRIYGLGRREVEEQTRICHSQSFMHNSGMVHFY